MLGDLSDTQTIPSFRCFTYTHVHTHVRLTRVCVSVCICVIIAFNNNSYYNARTAIRGLYGIYGAFLYRYGRVFVSQWLQTNPFGTTSAACIFCMYNIYIWVDFVIK